MSIYYIDKYKNSYWLAFILLILLFQTILTTLISDLFSITDEFVAVLGLWVIVSKSNKMYFVAPNQRKNVVLWRNCLLMIIFIGIISSVNSRLQPVGMIWVNDIFYFLKSFFVFIYCYYLAVTCNIKKCIGILSKVICVYLYLCLFFCLLNYVIDLPVLYDEIRFGLKNYRFFHPTAGDLSSVLVAIIAFLYLKSDVLGNKDKFLIVISVICMAATTRGKAFALIAAYFGLIIFFKHHKKLSKKSILSIVLLAIAFGWFQIETYFGADETPRALLLVYGFITASTYFPLGGGFASYGSNVARLHYSPLYVQYGFPNYYGMSEDAEKSFLNDNFWPMIMGQYGWIGVILYLIIIYQIFRLVYCAHGKNIQIAGFLIFFTLVFSSTAGSVFVHYLGCVLMATLALVLAAYKKMEYK